MDVIFVMGKPFLIGLLSPIDLDPVAELVDRSADEVGRKIKSSISTAFSRQFDVLEIHTNGEKAIAAMKSELANAGIELQLTGLGKHVPQVEKLI